MFAIVTKSIISELIDKDGWMAHKRKAGMSND